MADDKDGRDKSPDKTADKSPAPGGATPPSKKPSALIDLKATEVEVREVKPAAPASRAQTTTEATSAASAARPASGAASGSAYAKPLTPPPADPYSKPAAKPASKPAGASAADFIKPAEPVSAGKPEAQPRTGQQKPAATAPLATSRSPTDGLRGAATHLAAGLAGGLLALLGADVLAPALGPTLGLPRGAPAALSDDASRRLQALETAITTRGQPAGDIARDIAQKLAAAETRLARLDEMAGALKAVADQQTSLQLETKALGEKIVQPSPESGADARLAKLEDALSTLSTAAIGDPQRGRIPQLATITTRLQELEANVTTQVSTLRKTVTQELDSRLARTADAGEIARVGQQRLDRDLATVKGETSQLSQRVDTVKSVVDRTETGVRVLKDEAGELRSALDVVKGEIARELRQVARPADVHTAVAPIASRLAALEDNVQGVVKGESDRRANAERIVLALELGNLKRTIERGAPFAAELAEVRRIAGPSLDLTTLERLKDRGVPPAPELAREFRGLAHAIIEADAEPANASWKDRLLAGAKSIVRVRRVDQAAEDASIEAAVARIETDLKDGKLAEVATTAAKLPAKALAPARGWLDKVEARASVERALADVERNLKASLGARPAESPLR